MKNEKEELTKKASTKDESTRDESTREESTKEELTKENLMRAEALSEALGEVNADYVMDAAPQKSTGDPQKNTANPEKNTPNSRKNFGAIPILLFAAGFLLVAGLGIGALLHFGVVPFGKSPSGVKGPVKEEERLVSFVTGKEIARELPYEALEAEEQYLSLSFSGKGFRSRCNRVNEDRLTENLGSGMLFFGETREEREVRKIGNIDPDLLVAAKLPKDAGWGVYLRDDLWEVLHLDADEPEDTLRDLMERTDLENTLKLRVCYLKNESECRELEEGTAERILQILKDAENAPRIGNLMFERQTAYFEQKRVISFSITSEELGIKNRAFTLREGGVLEMNLLEYALYYDIGEDNVKKILSEILGHSTVIPEDPEGIHYLAGRIVKADAEELVLDDTDLCREGVEGWEYHFSGDLGKKYEWLVSEGKLKAGDLVSICFYGPKEQKEEGVWTINTRIEDVSEAVLSSDGEVLVKE